MRHHYDSNPEYPLEPFERDDLGRIICPSCGETNGSLYCGKCIKCIEKQEAAGKEVAGSENATL